MTDDWKESHRGFQTHKNKKPPPQQQQQQQQQTGYDHAERLGQDRRYIGQRSNTVATV